MNPNIPPKPLKNPVNYIVLVSLQSRRTVSKSLIANREQLWRMKMYKVLFAQVYLPWWNAGKKGVT